MSALILLWGLVCQAVLHQSRHTQRITQEAHRWMKEAEALKQFQALHQALKAQIVNVPKGKFIQELENFHLLQEEKQHIKALLQTFPDNLFLRERSIFLESDQNKIRFNHDFAQGSDLGISSVHYTLSHPVQMNRDDLRQFLAFVEGDRYDVARAKPFLVIKKFDLARCHEKGDEKVYELDVELLELR